MLAAGPSGYVLKRATVEQLVQAIRAVAEGGTDLDPKVAGNAVGNFLDPPAEDGAKGAELSERECVVMRLIAPGYVNKESPPGSSSVKTVETYKTCAMEKLDIRSRVELVCYAVRRGWLADAEPPAASPAAPSVARTLRTARLKRSRTAADAGIGCCEVCAHRSDTPPHFQEPLQLRRAVPLVRCAGCPHALPPGGRARRTDTKSVANTTFISERANPVPDRCGSPR